MFRPKKSLGQHFLKDGNVVSRIVEAIGAAPQDRIIEVGAGTGALTRALTQRYADVHVIEIDNRAVDVLREQVKGIVIHAEDVRRIKWRELVSRTNATHVISNLPYYITSPVLFSLLENRMLFKEALLMMQKEVAQRLVASPSTKEYGILSVQTQLMASPQVLFDVSPHSFVPPPKVVSSVVRLQFNKPPLPCADSRLKMVVRMAFNQRRKKLSNALSAVLGEDGVEGFDFGQRAEQWTPAIYAALAAQIDKKFNVL